MGVTGMRRFGAAVVFAAAIVLASCTSQVLTLDVGTCFDDPGEFERVQSTDVPAVDCDVPHDNEVYANRILEDAEFPGTEGIVNRADRVCLVEFEPYVGASYETSIYDFSWFVPTEDSWSVGDREVVCFAYHVNFDKITGSINGIGQ
jgi:hypothetical protein